MAELAVAYKNRGVVGYDLAGAEYDYPPKDHQEAFALLRRNNITVPMFISCGSLDAFAPPVVQKYLFDRVGSTDKTLVIFGKKGGFSADCGHNDTLVGRTSRQEVYPVIEKWLSH